MKLKCAGEKDIAQRKIQPQHISQLSQTRVPPRDAQLKGKFQWHTQPQAPNNEEASKGCATSRKETNHIKINLNSILKHEKEASKG
jgi:hypothetical protein